MAEEEARYLVRVNYNNLFEYIVLKESELTIKSFLSKSKNKK